MNSQMFLSYSPLTFHFGDQLVRRLEETLEDIDGLEQSVSLLGQLGHSELLSGI